MDEKRLEELFGDQEFVDALKAAGKAEEVVRLFAANGVEVSTEEAEKFLEGRTNGVQSGELNADELDAVAGGRSNCFFHGIYDGVTGKKMDKGSYWYRVGYVYGLVFRR